MDLFTNFISTLHSSKQQAIIWHHQTNTFGSHKTLENYYSKVIDLIDDLVESVSGIYEKPRGYQCYEILDYKSIPNTTEYFQTLYVYIQTERKKIYQETWIQNKIDEIAMLVARTIYLLSLQ